MFRTRLGHAHLKVKDLSRSRLFYQQFLNLKVTEEIDQFIFLSSNGSHHEIALQEVGKGAARPQIHHIGLYHVAFEVPDAESLAFAFKKLNHGGVEVTAIDHFISWALYFHDPDQNGLKIYWDTRKQPHGSSYWEGKSLPLNKRKLLEMVESKILV